MKINHAESMLQRNEEYWIELLESAPGTPESEDAGDRLAGKLQALLTPPWLADVERYEDLPDKLKEVLWELENMIAEYGLLCQQAGFNAGVEATHRQQIKAS